MTQRLAMATTTNSTQTCGFIDQQLDICCVSAHRHAPAHIFARFSRSPHWPLANRRLPCSSTSPHCHIVSDSLRAAVAFIQKLSSDS